MIAPVALLLALLAAATAPKLTLVVWPKGQRLWQGQPLYAGARVRIDDPERELACPEIRVSWGDGSASGVKSSFYGCDPYSLDAPAGYVFVPKMHAYREPPEHCERGYWVEACVVDVVGRCRAGLTASRLVEIKPSADEPCGFVARR